MAHPLELARSWRTPLVVATLGGLACAGLVLHGSAPGRWGVVVVVAVLWLVYAVVVWVRTRAFLQVDGPRLTVRRVVRTVTVEGSAVLAVRQHLTGHGPSYTLLVRDAESRRRRVAAPVALLRRGHSTLFSWLAENAPQAELDRGSRRTREELRRRGSLPGATPDAE